MRKRLASLTAIVVLVCSIFTSNSAMTTFSKSKQITTTSNELVSDENDVEVSNANNAEVGNASASVEGTELDKSAANNVNVNGTMMQYFEWNLPDNGSLWNQIADQADELADNYESTATETELINLPAEHAVAAIKKGDENTAQSKADSNFFVSTMNNYYNKLKQEENNERKKRIS